MARIHDDDLLLFPGSLWTMYSPPKDLKMKNMISVWRSIWAFFMLIFVILAIFVLIGVLGLILFPSHWLS